MNNYKKDIIIVISQLSFGGAQKSLISFLKAIPYEYYNIELYIREEKTDLLLEIPKQVKIIINKSKKNYNYNPFIIFGEIIKLMFIFLKFNKLYKKIDDLIKKYIVRLKNEAEKHAFFSNGKEYDMAISYMNGLTSKFVMDKIKAKKYICTYFASTQGDFELHRKYLPLYDTIITDSYGSAENIKVNYPDIQCKIKVIPNYIDAEEIRTKAKMFNIDQYKNNWLIVSCGRLSHVKGFDMAIAAASILKNKHIDFHWTFVGDGPERMKLEEQAKKLNLENDISFVGAQSNPYPYISACDIYVQPSYEESYGLTITEALILNRLVISTRTTGGKEQIQDGINGLLCDISSESIAESLLYLISDIKLQDNIKQHILSIDYSKNYINYRKQVLDLLS